ncbi:MAG: hypothetical protein EOP05_13950 [Proteobacteria bacterium]|nr:MAG: hypothetical protein EOP05_13950 [Pseudomonadota bacterium]
MVAKSVGVTCNETPAPLPSDETIPEAISTPSATATPTGGTSVSRRSPAAAARYTMATAYQSCSVLKLPVMTSSVEDLQGVERTVKIDSVKILVAAKLSGSTAQPSFRRQPELRVKGTKKEPKTKLSTLASFRATSSIQRNRDGLVTTPFRSTPQRRSSQVISPPWLGTSLWSTPSDQIRLVFQK